ncbi:DUF3810 domain-containing protein [Sediminibacterium sp.]|uniref:DUF3810 domain-containing protein n=1 Tax=Sediminibacterium sp. TaxID=1917865 RepID=UPI0025DAE875|nr:DUF3810 domain-containing protein [Sediminibacterium sp.]MBT9483151.1 DUF3810 domain-containing protein [Sediminibacterium sp.]
MQLIIDEKNIKKTFLLLLGGILTYLAGQSSWFVENCYVAKFYPLWSNFLKKGSNFFPFSLGDFIYSAFIIYLSIHFLKWFIYFLHSNQRITFFWSGLHKMLQFGLIGYMLFQLFWGFNYKRGGIALALGLNPTVYNQKQITELTNELIDSANYYRRQIGSDGLPVFTKKQLMDDAQMAYDKASIQFPFLKTTIQSVKFSLFEPIADYIGFSGYYNPFTGEAHLRNDLPGILNPFIICHEVAHQLGYASESEASFIGFLAAKSSSNSYLKYSMYLDLLNYSFNEQYLLYAKENYGAFEQVVKNNRNRMDTLVKKDRKDIRDFFYKRRNDFSPISNNLYDQFLKMNHQMAGIDSYNEVVAWLISYQKRKNENN